MESSLGPGERGSGLRTPSRRLGFKSPGHLGHPPPIRSSTQPPPHPPFRGSPPFIHPPPGITQSYSKPPPLYNAFGHGRNLSMDHRLPSVGLYSHQDQSGLGRGHRGGGPPPHSRGRSSYCSQPGRTRHPPLPASPPASPTTSPSSTPPTPGHPPANSESGRRTVVRIPTSVARSIFPCLKPGEASHLFWSGTVDASDPRIGQFCRRLLDSDISSTAVLQKAHPQPTKPLRRPAAAGSDPIPGPPGPSRGRGPVLHEATDAPLRGALSHQAPVNILIRHPVAGRRAFQAGPPMAGLTTASQGDPSHPPSPAPTPTPAL